MDIGILLGLQQFREDPGGFLTEFLTKMTWFGEMNVVLIIIALIYWCADKGTGTYLLMGWVLERRFVRFTTEGTMQQRFFRLTGGLLGYYIVSLIINPMIKSAAAGFAGTMITCFFQMFYIVFLFPVIITAAQKNGGDRQRNGTKRKY